MNIKKLPTEYNFNTSTFLFNIEPLDNHRILFSSLNKIYDFDNKSVLILNDRKTHYSLCKVSGKIYSEDDIVSMMRENYKFISLVINYINIIKALIKPKSLNYIDVIDSGYFELDNPILNKDIEIKWYMKNDYLINNDKLIITIF